MKRLVCWLFGHKPRRIVMVGPSLVVPVCPRCRLVVRR